MTKENGRSLCDIGINGQIGIELKKDFNSKSKVDRLAGQILEFKKQYQDLIIVLVGKTNKESLEYLMDKKSDLTGNTSYGFNKEPRINIIDKGSKNSDATIKENVKRDKSPPVSDRPYGLNLNNLHFF